MDEEIAKTAKGSLMFMQNAGLVQRKIIFVSADNVKGLKLSMHHLFFWTEKSSINYITKRLELEIISLIY
jgi:hypothetical protein